METILSVVKSVIDAFSKKISLYPLLVSGAVVSFVVAYFESSHIALYVSIGLFLFCICDFSGKLFVKYRKKRIDSQFRKWLSDSDNQKKLLLSFDIYELDVLADLYDVYPNGLLLDITNAAVATLYEQKFLYCFHTLGVGSPGGSVFYTCSLQKWMKQCIDKNRDLFYQLLAGEDIEFDGNKEEQVHGNQ